jgi:hypothetical protein
MAGGRGALTKGKNKPKQTQFPVSEKTAISYLDCVGWVALWAVENWVCF